ncbi:MAG: flagella basal body P-ring formation protein FlgA [Sandaracinaceae bacterium]
MVSPFLRSRTRFMAGFALVSLLSLPAAAQDEVRLAELIPALAETELGRLPITAAPPPGGRVVVRRSDVLAALRRADRPTGGLAIPARTVIRRDAQELDADALAELAAPSAAAVMAPCRVTSIEVHGTAAIPPGEGHVTVEGQAPRRGGATPMVLLVGPRQLRVPAHARVECPAPVIAPGRHVRLEARYGNVVASMPGVARQPGRVGDVIRVTSGPTRRVLRARVRDANTLEVVP